MSKIFIIENQITQFKALKKGLVSNNVISLKDVFPSDDEWPSFMNHVKIAINKDYDYIESGEYQRIAKEKLYNKITEEKPDLLIIDYLLGGTTCEKGDELAKDIINNVINPQFAIVFLSREHSTSDYDDFKEKNKGIMHIDWLSKSYSSDDVLEDNYIKNVLCREIKAILRQNKEKELLNKLKKYFENNINTLASDNVKIFKQIINRLENNTSLSDKQINLLRAIIESNKTIIDENEEIILLSIN